MLGRRANSPDAAWFAPRDLSILTRLYIKWQWDCAGGFLLRAARLAPVTPHPHPCPHTYTTTVSPACITPRSTTFRAHALPFPSHHNWHTFGQFDNWEQASAGASPLPPLAFFHGSIPARTCRLPPWDSLARQLAEHTCLTGSLTHAHTHTRTHAPPPPITPGHWEKDGRKTRQEDGGARTGWRMAAPLNRCLIWAGARCGAHMGSASTVPANSSLVGRRRTLRITDR